MLGSSHQLKWKHTNFVDARWHDTWLLHDYPLIIKAYFGLLADQIWSLQGQQKWIYTTFVDVSWQVTCSWHNTLWSHKYMFINFLTEYGPCRSNRNGDIWLSMMSPNKSCDYDVITCDHLGIRSSNCWPTLVYVGPVEIEIYMFYWRNV